MGLHNLKPAPGSRRAKKRIGRGPGSGIGKTSGRGEKGQKSRSGYSRKVGFEGGQMPLHRRVPKRGFRNAPFRKEFAVVNIDRLEIFEPGDVVTPELLRELRIVRRRTGGIKILGEGALTKALTVKAHKFSRKAQERIVALGGKAEVIGAHSEPAAQAEGGAESSEG